MPVLAFGINHKTAPVHIREKVAFAEGVIIEALNQCQQDLNGDAVVILSTCNRTEVYVQADVSAEALLTWVADYHGLSGSELHHCSYVHQDNDAITHIMRVASGLDSLILGEPQVLGQVKQAYTQARNGGTLNKGFERLFQHTFEVAKRVRAETEIGANAVSVAYASVQLAKQVFGALNQTRVLLIGAGETIELVARYLKEEAVAHICVANRTLSRAQTLAGPLQGQAITLSQIPYHLAEADVVFSSTASQLPILGKGVVERALHERKHKPMFLVDLAVPRDIEGEVSELEDAYLYAVDDLQQIVQENLASRQQAAQQAQKMIAHQVLAYNQWHQSQRAIDGVRVFRRQAQAQKDKLLARAQNQLQEGADATTVLEELANKLTNSLIHGPTRALQQAAARDEQQVLGFLHETLELNSDK